MIFVAAIVIVAAVCFAIVWRPTIPRQTTRQTFAQATIDKGAQLAAIGNCITCHTKPGGVPYAGGRAVPTPFGAVYSVNITPDRNTGIGGWSEPAFRRAMKEGVSRDGHYLYPAFPYDHMRRMRDDDVLAVYAFMMTRKPVRARAPENDLAFPFDLRPLLAGWNLLFLNRGVLPNNPAKSPEWNRGAYLVEGLGHCGACHTPRNSFGAEQRDKAYAGGNSEGWMAPALNAAAPAAVPWDADRLYHYLRTGFDPLHGIATGPMASVVDDLKSAPDADVRAIATYVADLAGATSADKQANALKVMARVKEKTGAPLAGDQPGASIYAGACAQCHGELGRKPTNPAVDLAVSSTLRLSSPDNAIRIVLLGIHPSHGAGPIMPSFANVLTDDQLSALLQFLRSYFAEQPPWPNVRASVAPARQAASQEARMQP